MRRRGSFLAATGGFQPGDYATFEPEWFGAVGDNGTDDTAALQQCLDAALQANGTVQLRAKTYCFDHLTFRGGTARIKGAGWYATGGSFGNNSPRPGDGGFAAPGSWGGSTLRCTATSTTDLIYAIDCATTPTQYPTPAFEDFYLTSFSNTADSKVCGIRIGTRLHAVCPAFMKRVFIGNFYRGLSATVYSSAFFGVQCVGNDTGIYLDQSGSSVFHGTTLNLNRVGVYCDASTMVFESGTIQGTGETSVVLSPTAHDCTFRGLWIENAGTATHSFYINAGSQNATIQCHFGNGDTQDKVYIAGLNVRFVTPAGCPSITLAPTCGNFLLDSTYPGCEAHVTASPDATWATAARVAKNP